MMVQVDPQQRSYNDVAWSSAVAASTVFLLVVWSSVLDIGRLAAYGWFAFHPTLMSVGVVAATYAILVVQPPSKPSPKPARIALHQLVLAVAPPSILLGATAIYYKKETSSADHITTWHATLGITSVIYMLFQVLLGTAIVWPTDKAFSGTPGARLLRKLHRLSGYALCTMFVLTIYLGGEYSTWSRNTTSFLARFIEYVLAPLVMFTSMLYRGARQ